MLAAVFYGVGDIRLEEVDKPPAPENGEILIKVRACGICGTDIRIYRGEKTRGVRNPSIIGHEFSGDVVAVGKDVDGFVEGDKVAVFPVIACKDCYYCINGMENLCINRTTIGYEYDGAFAEFVKISASAVKHGNVVKVPESISYEEAALAEPLSCCLNGFEKARVSLGSTVVIVGAGPIGLMHVQLARLGGAGKIIVSEVLDNRLDVAKKLGADVCVNPTTENLEEAILRHTEHRGADSIIMAIGEPHIADTLLKCVRKQGVINFFSGFPLSSKVSMDVNLIHYGEIIIVGTSASSSGQFRRSMSLLSGRKVSVSGIVSHRFSLGEIREGFQVALNRTGIKVMICDEVANKI